MGVDNPLIEFRLDVRSGVPTYLQLVQQVKHALRIGILQPGDQLPTVKEVVGRLAINPNTVLKAYRELDREGLVEARRGQGTFVSLELPAAEPGDYTALRSALLRWIERARAAGLGEGAINALLGAPLPAGFFWEAGARNPPPERAGPGKAYGWKW